MTIKEIYIKFENNYLNDLIGFIINCSAADFMMHRYFFVETFVQKF